MTLPLNKRCTSSSVTLKNNRPHITYTHMQPQIMKLCAPTDCKQPTLSLSLAVRESHCVVPPPLLFFFVLSHIHGNDRKVPVSGNSMIKEMWGEEGV